MTPELPQQPSPQFQQQTPNPSTTAAPTGASTPQADTTPQNTTRASITANKGLIIAVIVGIIVVVVGISATTNFGKTDKFQGMIQKVEQDTQELSR